MDNALLAGIDAPAVPAAVSATRAHGHHSSHEVVRELDGDAVATAETVSLARSEQATAFETAAAADAQVLSAAEAVTTAVAAAAAAAAGAQPSDSSVHADTTAPSSAADQGTRTLAAGSPDATGESAVHSPLVTAEDGKVEALLTQTQAALLQAESRVQGASQQVLCCLI